MSKVLVTGGAGYIGSVIASLLLEKGFQVRVVDILWFDEKVPLAHRENHNYEFFRADLSENKVLEKYIQGVDFVVHAAAVVGEPATKKYPQLTQKINYDTSINLINKSISCGIKGFLFLSTCSNYGVCKGIADEESDLKALSLYAETKINVERYLMEKVKNLGWVICRLSTVYGLSPRMRFDLTVNDFTLNAYLNKQLSIFLPYTFRPYIHVADVARIIVALIQKFPQVKNNVFNTGFQGENYQKIQIAQMVKKFIPDLKIEVTQEGSDLRDYRVGFSKLESCLGMKNKFNLEEGIREVLGFLNSASTRDFSGRIYYNTQPRLEVKV